MKYVIVGNSAAAVGGIEGIRGIDGDNPIVVVSREPGLAYSRPLISELLARKIGPDLMPYRDEKFYRENGVELLLGREAVSIDWESRAVVLSDRSSVPYDRLLIATGGTPFVPPIEGLDCRGVHTFTTWSDADEIAREVAEVSGVVVIGGGLIGLKATESLKELGLTVTVIELANRVLSTALDEVASRMVERHLEEAGVSVILGNSVREVRSDGSRVCGVVLRDGRELDCEMVIVAIGVRPNVDLVRGTPIEVNRGILVDDRMRTSVEGVYAAGDVTESYDIAAGVVRPIPIWPNAHIQGMVAGDNMAGGSRRYPGGIGMNSLSILGLPTISVGVTEPPNEGYQTLSRSNPGGDSYRKLVLRDDVIVGAVFVGDCIDRAGIITGLIRERVPVGPFKDSLLDDDFGLASLPRDLRVGKLTMPV
ncbi:MAG: NAD(P)/FAD-dependent oxidoreductase [bacterium]